LSAKEIYKTEEHNLWHWRIKQHIITPWDVLCRRPLTHADIYQTSRRLADKETSSRQGDV